MSYQKPPPYADQALSFTPAQTYQPGQPQGGIYPQMPPQQPPTVIIQTETRPQLVALGNQPSRVTCPSCHAEILTTAKHEENSCTCCRALILCLFICLPCACMPFGMDSSQNANHYCPNCNATFKN